MQWRATVTRETGANKVRYGYRGIKGARRRLDARDRYVNELMRRYNSDDCNIYSCVVFAETAETILPGCAIPA